MKKVNLTKFSAGSTLLSELSYFKGSLKQLNPYATGSYKNISFDMMNANHALSLKENSHLLLT